jgi:putative hemolysin
MLRFVRAFLCATEITIYMTEMLIIALLMVLNGVFAMSEAAVIATRKARLQQEAEKGNRRARAALKLADDPNRVLSTVQIGITLIGILAGVFGGATVAQALAIELRKIPALAPYAQPLSFSLVVLLTTYLSLIIGELVPKRLALRYPEKILKQVAIPMRSLSKLAAPAVFILSVSTDAILWLLGMRADTEPPVTADEIKAMVQQGVDAGVFQEADHEMVDGIFRLNDRRVKALMTPRTEVVWLNLEESNEEQIRKITDCRLTRFPVAEGDLDHVLGVVSARDLFARSLQGEPFDVRAAMMDALFVPESMLASRVMQMFKEQGRQIALVMGEHGGIQGVVTLQDLLNQIVGGVDELDKPGTVQRDDGSWLLDGLMPVDDFKRTVGIDDVLPGEHNAYETLGGFVMAKLGRIPASADKFEWERYTFEVMDMDGNRVDKVLVVVPEKPAVEDAEEVKSVEEAS